ncbi:MAG: hypothetical protein H6Q81_2639, partial [Deltaproteobacteria bacterium]|nr:hypothetical protein [Deltaproteobacteria bacterium]
MKRFALFLAVFAASVLAAGWATGAQEKGKIPGTIVLKVY